MTLPQVRTPDGEVLTPDWTRLKPSAEVAVEVPDPPLFPARPGMKLGPAELTTEGEGFELRTVAAAVVLEDDGVWRTGFAGPDVKLPPSTGRVVRYEPQRAWTAADVNARELDAEAILRAHDFPVHIQWPNGVWAWSQGDLFWADVPPDSAVIEGDYDDDMSGVLRAGLGWPEGGAQRYDNEAASRLWPRFSPFGWALTLWDMQGHRRRAVGTLARWMLEGRALELERALWSRSDDRIEDLASEYRRAAEAIRSEIPGPPTGKVSAIMHLAERDAEMIWRLGFDLGAYMAEHRLRAVHGDFVSQGQSVRAERSRAGKKTTAKARRKAAERQAVVRDLALGKLRGLPPGGRKSWSKAALALAVWDAWPPDSPRMSVATCEDDIAALGGVVALQALVKTA